ncbi:MAG: DNA mismatch repair endonuclease MutL, partial [Spirochaetales bacterium]
DMGYITVLRDQDARRIAAGEVIERPASIVRELLDNALDAGAAEIEVHLLEGGIREVRVIDNGSGMDREDLDLCWRPHATSKIRCFEDIYTTRTLGFRGEALSSIAACSRLTLTTRRKAAPSAFRLRLAGGGTQSLEECTGSEGTVASVQDVFYAMPGRKKFLKRPSTEAFMCRQQVIEKAIPPPSVSFRLFSEGELKFFLPPGDLAERIRLIHPDIPWDSQIYDIEDSENLHIIAGHPGIARRDRKLIHIFVNGRKINEFALVQAVEYAFSDHLPGGSYPVAFVLLTVDPKDVDFNIHPAKREAKFRNLPELHHAVLAAIKNKLAVKPSLSGSSGSFGSSAHPLFVFERAAFPVTAFNRAEFEPAAPAEAYAGAGQQEIQYIGQVFGLFLIAMEGDTLYFIDQHAAHESILYSMYEEKKPAVQTMLTPISLTLEEDEEPSFASSIDAFGELGFTIKGKGAGSYEIHTLPEIVLGAEDAAVSFIRENRGTLEDLKKVLYAGLACKKAVKEGETLDSLTARDIINRVFLEGLTRCPHGRPIFFSLGRERMAELVGRTGPAF